jgi:hypothetical protein
MHAWTHSNTVLIRGRFTYPTNISKFLEQIYIGQPWVIMFISKPSNQKRLFHLENQLEIKDYKFMSAGMNYLCHMNYDCILKYLN